MLKAVRFDEEKNKELINFIESYLDGRGKPNHSEAIRYLMEKGFEFINNKPIIHSVPKIEISNNEKDLLKQELMDEVLKMIGKNALQHPQPQIVYQSIPEIEKPVNKIEPREIKNTPIQKPKVQTNVGGLLGNIINNSQRG